MFKKQKGFTLWELTWVIVFFLGAGGWVANIVKLFGYNFDQSLTIGMIMRIVGIPIVPLGAVMGYL